MKNEDKMVSDALRGSWVHRFLPQSLWPYAQLARWERPIGWQLLMWPCWWSAALALNIKAKLYSMSLITTWYYPWPLPEFLHFLILFVLGAFVMRGAGCTYNDLVDQNIDDQVARTRSRPLPSGRVSRRNAWMFLGAQLLIGLLILLQFNAYTILLGLASLITILIYPFMKRITWWPQLFLGLAFSWGALVGWTAMLDELGLPAVLLYLGSICWVIGFDTIYAHQDIEDDALVGVKSTARLFAEKTKAAVIILYAIALALFASAFWEVNVAWPAWVGLGAGAAHMIWQIQTLDINDPARCLKLFKSNSVFGLILFLGLVAAAYISSDFPLS